DRLEAEMCGSVAPRELEGHQNLAVGPQRQAVLGDGRTQEISTKLLEPIPILARNGDARMQVEAVTARLKRPRRLDPGGVRVGAQTVDPRPGAGPERDPALHRRARESG